MGKETITLPGCRTLNRRFRRSNDDTGSRHVFLSESPGFDVSALWERAEQRGRPWHLIGE
jgi:hypothetical protein